MRLCKTSVTRNVTVNFIITANKCYTNKYMVKKSKKSATPKKQKSRAKYQCPPEIEELIKWANRLPDNSLEIEKMMFETLCSFATKENIIYDSEENGKAFIDKFFVLLEPDDMLEYLYPGTQTWDCNQAYKRYFDLNTAKQFFQSVIKGNKKTDEFFELEGSEYFKLHKADGIRKQDVMDEVLKNDRKIDLFKFLFDWRDAIEKGKSTALFDLATWLHSPHPNFDRLRACEICQNIFWAVREDSFTCSKRCSSNRRTRLSRSLTDEEKAEIKAQKEKNKEYKRKLNARKNSNGNL